MITVTIDGVDRTSLINWRTFVIERNITSQPDYCRFTIGNLSAVQTYYPTKGDEIEVTNGGTTIFAGVIIGIMIQTVSGASGQVNIIAKDFQHYADRKQVIETYESQTVEYIIKDIVHKYCSDGIKCLSFDGVDDHIDVGAVSGGTAIKTFEMWIKPTALTGMLLDCDGGTNTISLVAGTVTTTGITSPTIYVNGAVSSTVVADQWQYIVVTTGTGVNCSGLIMGQGATYYSGLMDEIVLRSAELSAGNVTTQYNGGFGTYVTASANIVGIWHLDEGQGSTANDDSGLGNNGTITSGTWTWGKISSNILIDYVDALTDTPDKIRFAYTYPTLAFQELADLTDCEWYIDYDRVLHFQKKGTKIAPFNLTEDKESLIYDSFTYNDDLSQIRNAIYVRGGTERYTTDSATAEKYVCDGQQRVFPLGQKYINDAIFSVAKDTGGGFVALTVGIYGSDDATLFDVMYDSNNRSLIFEEADKPAATNVLRIYGNYYLPVIVYLTDIASIAQYGTYEFRIIDRTITSRLEARQRARAELFKYGESIDSGSFSTYQDGLEPGMMITATLPTLGVSRTLYIQKVVMRPIEPTAGTFEYKCTIVGTELVDSLDILLRLLIKDVNKNIEMSDDEILDKIYGSYETITLTEPTWSVTAHPSGSPTFTEAVTETADDTQNCMGTDLIPLWYAGVTFMNTGYAGVFNGTTQFLLLAADITLSGEFTVCGWINYSGGDRMILGHTASNNNKIGFYSSKWFVRVVSGATGDNAVAAVSTGTWHFFAVRRNASNKVDLFVDGGAAQRLFSDAAQAGNFIVNRIGATDAGQYWKDYMDGIRFWNRSLLDAEITSQYNAGNGTPVVRETNLVGAFEMDENDASTKAIDASGNNKTGTWQATPSYITGKIATSYPKLSRKRQPQTDAGLYVV